MKIIEKDLHNWFKKKDKKINLNHNFIKNNTIDSFDLMELISFCEKKYDFKFENKDLDIEKFNSIKNIIKIIKDRQK